MNNLYVHIGTPKTATTALQHFMMNNREQLLQQGYEYIDEKKEFPENRGLRVELDKLNMEEMEGVNGGIVLDANFKSLYEKSQNIDEIFDLLDNKLKQVYSNTNNFESIQCNVRELAEYFKKKLEKNHVILSNEILWVSEYSWIKEFREVLKDRLKIVVYLRRQDHYIESLWNEDVDRAQVTLSVQDFFNEVQIDPIDGVGIHYRRRLNKICDIIGKENLIVKTYEKSRFMSKPAGIISDFFSAIGVQYEGKNWNKNKSMINGHLGGSAVNFMRLFNQVPDLKSATGDATIFEGYEVMKKYKDIFIKLGLRGNPANAHRQELYFSAEERKRLLALFEDSNKYIAREYMGKEDGESMFTELVCDLAPTVAPLTQNEEDMFTLFLEIMCRSGIL